MEGRLILAMFLGRIAVFVMANGGRKRFSIISNEELKLSKLAGRSHAGFCLMP